MISSGEEIPGGIAVDILEASGSEYVDTACADFSEELKKQKCAILFAVPGAFTPTCSEKHLPGFVEKAGELKKKGVDAIYCMSVNDKFVMKAWAKSITGCSESGIKMVGDGNAELTNAMGLTKDASGGRMGTRCTRFAAIIESGKVKEIFVDAAGFENSTAEKMLSLL
eukprot:CAMPEP_0182427152 /NCGR_PEP_ID=MMETSP1167-20130531/14960_1 /TAXON_ID=2988 /ORGANISM="Mallomonas Sp, Strain CCMP3275" /LENGTH=167 /DNA_ID=CAMNT_0024609139 /DNA_START=121 /DNA_END=624 /DNA_ORIENTATION=-